MLGFLLHISLGELLGLGSIFPFSLPIAIFPDDDSPLRDAYAWEIVILSLVLPYLCRRDLRGWGALWVNKVDIGLLIALPVGAFMASFLGEMLIDQLLGTSAWTPTDDIRSDLNEQSANPLSLFLYALTPTCIAPVVEELVFRGLLYTHIRAKMGPLPTILITGALFGLLHGGPLPYAVSIVLSGIIYGIVREKTGGITAHVAAHLLNNVIATLSLL